MQKIQKFIKKHALPIICFIIGIFITVAATFYATETKYSSSNVTYNNISSELSSTNIQAAIDELKGKIDRRGFKLGDYFTMVPDVTRYVPRSSTLGFSPSVTETIRPSELTLWRVINIFSDGSFEAVSEYVAIGSLPAYPTAQIAIMSIQFGGVTGYSNFVGGLQTIAAQYAKAGYTINTRMMGYGGQTPTIQPKSSTCTETCQTTTTYAFDGSTNNAPSTISTSDPYIGVGQEYNGGVLGDTLYLKDIQLVGDVYKTNPDRYGEYGLKAYSSLYSNSSVDYWIASRKFSYSSSNYFYWKGRYISSSGFLDSTDIKDHCSKGSYSVCNHSFRPIITLKSGIQITGGTGTIDNPYTITN